MSEAFALAMHRSRFEGKVSRPIMTVEADASSGPPSMPEPDENFYRLMMVRVKGLLCVQAASCYTAPSLNVQLLRVCSMWKMLFLLMTIANAWVMVPMHLSRVAFVKCLHDSTAQDCMACR